MNTSYLKNRYHEVFMIEPSDLGNPTLTRMYKSVTRLLKVMPFIYLIPLSIAASVVVSLVFGLSVVRIASVLQNGF